MTTSLTSYSEFACEAALCAWEWVMEGLCEGLTNNSAAEVLVERRHRAGRLRSHIEAGGGMATCRLQTIEMGAHIAAWWVANINDDAELADLVAPFDWEFVPLVMSNLQERADDAYDGSLFNSTAHQVAAACDTALATFRKVHADRNAQREG